MKKIENSAKKTKTGASEDRTDDPLEHLGTGSVFTTTPSVQACLKTEVSGLRHASSPGFLPLAPSHRLPRFKNLNLQRRPLLDAMSLAKIKNPAYIIQITSKDMVRFLGSFRTHWYRSYGPIFPFKQSPKSSSETLAMVYHDSGHGNSIRVPRKLANTSLITKTNTKHVNNA